MFRKLILALGITAAVGAAAFAPTGALAGGHGHGHGHGHHFHGHGHYQPGYASGGCFYVKKLVATPYGLVKKPVLVCG